MGLFYFWIAVNGNQRKRGRESAAAAYQMVPTPQLNLLTSPSIQSPALVSLAQLQSQAAPPSMVSTGLKLSFDGNNNNNNNNNHQTQNLSQLRSQSTRFVQQDLASLINNQRDEIEQYLVAQVPKIAFLFILFEFSFSFVSLNAEGSFLFFNFGFCRESS